MPVLVVHGVALPPQRLYRGTSETVLAMVTKSASPAGPSSVVALPPSETMSSTVLGKASTSGNSDRASVVRASGVDEGRASLSTGIWASGLGTVHAAVLPEGRGTSSTAEAASASASCPEQMNGAVRQRKITKHRIVALSILQQITTAAES